jgi:hypothetical protein
MTLSQHEPDTPPEARGMPLQYEELVEQIWRDTGECVAPVRIRQLIATVAAEFREATVTTYLPMLIRRQVCQRLRQAARLSGVGSSDPPAR